RAQVPLVPADREWPLDERAQRVYRGVVRNAQRRLESGTAGKPLQLGRSAAGDDSTVVDDSYPVCELVRLVTILSRQEHGHPFRHESADHRPDPAAAA